MLFGLNVSTSAEPGADPVADARRAEGLGFDFVSASDHLHGRSPTYETWTMLSWIAAGTSQIGVATRVLGVPYRKPRRDGQDGRDARPAVRREADPRDRRRRVGRGVQRV